MSYTGHYVYDVECLPNFFSLRATRWEDKAKWCFEISEWKNQGAELFQFLVSLKQSRGRMVGFNNENYDYPMIHLIFDYQGHVNNAILYNKSQAIFKSRDTDDRSHFIWADQRHIPQVDLFKIHHFDNKAKMTSLKLLQFNMRLTNIIEMQTDWNKPIDRLTADRMLAYNDHDVYSTGMFCDHSRKQIDFRDQLSEKYGKDFTNHNDTRIGQDFFVMELAKKGIRANKWNQTQRSHIKVSDVLLPYIKFETPGFQQVHEFFKQTVINPEQIKGFFGSRDASKTKCTANITEALAATMDPDDVRVHYRDGTASKYSERDWTKPVKYLRPINIHTVVNGFRFDFGAGGIHGSVHNRIVVPRPGWILRDSDAKSYYPNLSIANDFFPLHLTKVFCDVYRSIYEQRKTYKSGSAENNMLKLALNGVYGKSNDKHSPFYDPQYTMAITINGQLLLCMLAEQLMKIPGVELIQINTDGLTYLCPEQYISHADALNEWWQRLTKLELEHVEYIKMAVRDVNNYLAVTKPYVNDAGELVPPKIKRIGAYAHERAAENDGTRELPWHKDQSAIVVAKAAEAALVRGENIEQFIRRHLMKEPLDFMLRTKVNRSDWLFYETKDSRTEMQRVTRYFVSNSGGQLFKEMLPTDDQKADWLTATFWRHTVKGTVQKVKKQPSKLWVKCGPPTPEPPIRRNGVDAGFNVTIANDLTGLDMSDVNIAYYVKATRKLVDELILSDSAA